MVVPGGRFRESYYWDSYWIVRGLLLSDMHETAKFVILNFIEDINNFGFVPNGARIYYLDRS
jgi:alpha,alpha-trehalase